MLLINPFTGCKVPRSSKLTSEKLIGIDTCYLSWWHLLHVIESFVLVHELWVCRIKLLLTLKAAFQVQHASLCYLSSVFKMWLSSKWQTYKESTQFVSTMSCSKMFKTFFFLRFQGEAVSTSSTSQNRKSADGRSWLTMIWWSEVASDEFIVSE